MVVMVVEMLDRAMSKVYFRWAYHPSPVPQPPAGLPVEYHVASVPWIVEGKPVCQSVALQMIAAHYGADRSRAEIDFLMGFTYGAGYRADWGFLTVGIDPETGIAAAAPFLGLVAHYQTGNNADRFVAALQAGLAADHPVRVPLDMASLYGKAEPVPHNEVLVGYDPTGFYYYEPISLSPSPCPPGRQAPGARGLYVEADRLLEAVRRQAEVFGYPWHYAWCPLPRHPSAATSPPSGAPTDGPWSVARGGDSTGVQPPPTTSRRSSRRPLYRSSWPSGAYCWDWPPGPTMPPTSGRRTPTSPRS
jgi:hypothetical protein